MKNSNKDQTNFSAYNPSVIEQKWQKSWEESRLYSPNLDTAKKPFYNLMMFPYPSAEGLHVGNVYAFTGADVYGRFMRMQGNDVFEPMGLDGFGIHSENYALKIGKHPMEQAKIAEANFYRQLRSIGNGFDWERKLETYDPNYYKWTQWIFVKLFKEGLAYRKKSPVNWCPSCKTVLSDEQVIDGKCERCSSIVEKKDLEQWFFKITDYAERLLNNIESLDWSEKVKIAQKQWIGKSEGTQITFGLKNVPGQPDLKHTVNVFTTRPDTLFGATFLAVSPELGKKWLDVGWQAPEEVKEYIEKSLGQGQQKRKQQEREKTGVFAKLNTLNPVNNEEIPVWIADYVLGDYGTGALFGDAHDERDAEFAKKYSIPLKPTIKTGNKEQDERIMNLEEVYTGYGTLFDSGQFTGLTSEEAIQKITVWLEEKGSGGKKTTYHLRDWLISRQRYWGPPIPMIFCENCAKAKKGEREDMPGWFSVPQDQLPVELPHIEDYKPLGTGKSPLGSHPEFYETTCPGCGGKAERETDVSDTFLDSSWYFLRYISTDKPDSAWDNKRVKKWMPVTMYIGGAEHSVLHLLYSRFLGMAFKDMGYYSHFEEPFAKFFAHGLIIKDGVKMSKSKGNVVVPDAYIAKLGADTLRTYLMFLGPFNEGGDFRDSGIEGMNRFMKRVWTLLTSCTLSETTATTAIRHKTIKKVTEDLGRLRYNTAIAAIMEYYNLLSKEKAIHREDCQVLLKLLAPFAPHITEELWANVVGGEASIHISPWPDFDPKLVVEEEVIVAVQINGKTRDSFVLDKNSAVDQFKVEDKAKAQDRVKTYLEGKSVKKVIFVPGKIINFVTE